MIGKTLSHYRITGHLGAGGMGEVYKAEDTKLGREVAIKVLQTDVVRDTVRLERFSREARAVAALNHPNIVTIYSVEEADGKHFITMELVEGETLDERIVEGGLPLNRLFDIALPLADALCSAHEKGIVHRDLKPANVMVTKSGSLKVLDFGLAKLQDTDSDVADAETVSRLLTQDGTVLGTYPYMSPEQVEGKHLDQRTDLFSLGTMVYELATGNRPFAGDSSPALMSSILRDEPGPLSEIRPDLPRHLERIVRRCLEKNRRDRYQSARSLYNELKGLRRESVSDASSAIRSLGHGGTGQSAKLTWIAVLPIKGTGSNQEMQDFADGLAEDITAGLSKFPYLSIVARESTLKFAGQTSDIREISEQLGARYVIDGGIRKAGATIRVSMRLVDAQTGTNLWVETYTRNTEAQDIFATQDDITERVVATVADGYGVLARAMIAEIEDKPDEELAHSEWMLRTFDHLSHMTPESHAHTREGLEQAVKRFPRNPDVWACLSQLYLHEHCFLFNPKPDPLDRALEAAEKAIDLDRTCQFGYQLLAQTHFFRQDLAAFRAATERAISLNPLDSNTMGILGIVTVHSGDFERGAELTRRAMEMNPHHAGWYHFGPLWLHFANREYDRALARVIQVNMPGLFWTYLATATICGHLGREREARTAVRKLLELDPEFGDNTRQSISVWHFTSGLMEPILEGLRKAGLDVPGEDPGSGEASESGATTVTGSLDPTAGDTAPRSLAVLPLANLSGDPEQEFFVVGMHDALINELARIRALTVISRTSTIPFAGSTEPLPEIAAKLGVEAVIEGSVLKAGNQVRINLQLVNAHPEKHLWADSFDGAMEDILDLHRRVAGEVSSAVRAQLTEDEEERLETTRKVDPQVYEIYLRARHLGFMTAEPSFQGIRLYEKAIALDQGFAPAYAGMARNYVFLSTLGASSPLGSLAKAAEAARRAMELDPESGEARSIHGYVSLFLDWDWQGAAEAMAEAREMEPNSVMVLADSVLFLALSGDTEQAILHANRATELDPMSPQTLFWKGWARFVAERYEEAIAGFKDSLEIDPDGAYPTLWIGAARGLMGKHAEALVWARRAEDLATDSKNTDFLAVLAATYVMGGQPDEARRILKRVESLENEKQSFPTQRSYIHGWLGEYEEAADLSDIAFDERNPGVIFWGNHPVCDASRAHPRIVQRLKELGFPAIRPMKPWQPIES